jgi:hypothetical protein
MSYSLRKGKLIKSAVSLFISKGGDVCLVWIRCLRSEATLTEIWKGKAF